MRSSRTKRSIGRPSTCFSRLSLVLLYSQPCSCPLQKGFTGGNLMGSEPHRYFTGFDLHRPTSSRLLLLGAENRYTFHMVLSSPVLLLDAALNSHYTRHPKQDDHDQVIYKYEKDTLLLCLNFLLGLDVYFAPEALLNAKYDVQWHCQHLLFSHHDHHIFSPREFWSIPEVDLF